MAKTSKKIIKKKRIYYDTNVWISWVKDRPTARKQIQQLDPTKCIAIVSDIIMAEAIHNLRQIWINETKYTSSDKEHVEKVKSGAEAKIKDYFTKPMEKMQRDGKVLMETPSIDNIELHNKILQKMKNYPGVTRTVDTCPKCGTQLNNNFKNTCKKCKNQIKPKQVYKYKGLGYADLMHAYTAHLLKVDILYSFDTGFKGLQTDKDFSCNFCILQQ